MKRRMLLKNRISEMKKETQKFTEENNSLKIRMEQMEANDLMRNDQISEQSQRMKK